MFADKILIKWIIVLKKCKWNELIVRRIKLFNRKIWIRTQRIKTIEITKRRRIQNWKREYVNSERKRNISSKNAIWGLKHEYSIFDDKR